MKIIIILLLIGLVAWIIYSYVASNVEQLKYVVLEKRDKFEIRKYDDYIEAKVEIPSTGMPAVNQGFRILANYIFGGNFGGQKVAMTAPVLAEENKLGGDGEKVAMTSPVLAQENDGTTSVVFSMPEKYTLDTLPKTDDKRIHFAKVTGKKYAVYSFSWYYSTQRIEEKKKEFLEILKNENIKTIGEPIFAGYNAPGTFPPMVRNEILVEIE